MYSIKNITRTWLVVDDKTLLSEQSTTVKNLTPEIKRLIRKGALCAIAATKPMPQAPKLPAASPPKAVIDTNKPKDKGE